MLTLNDGRSELWQWDTGRTLNVDVECSQVHFSNKVFGRSIDVDVVDGMAIIPDVLLQTDKDLTAWAFVGTPENGYTKISKVFKVNKRNKPSDYVFTPPEQTTLGEILERLDDIESSQDPDAIKNAVDDYLANNPIKVEEKDPTVPEWAKQPTPPDVKIPDKLPNPHSITFTGAVNASYDGSDPVEITIPDSGGNAEDGFSPIATVTQTDSGAVISITDKNGETTATITNGKDGKDGVDGQPGKDGYTPQKGIDYFDGQPGKDGVDGKDGYTPVKGKDYFDGNPGADGADGVTPHIGSNGNWFVGNTDTGKPSRGADGQPGQDGSPGKDGSAGKDGTSVTVSKVTESTADGGSNVVTFSDGNTITIKNGSKGSTGATGATGSAGKNGSDGYTPVRGTDYWTEADKVEIVQRVIESLGGNPIFGVVDSNNHIVLNGDLPDGTYSVKYEMANGSTVNIGDLVLDSNVYYSVTNQLTNCTNSNSATQAIGGQAYSATITANSGYELKSVTVTMGGSSVPVSGGKINIVNVTGDIVITAVAEEKASDPVTVDIALTDGIRIGSDGGDRALAGYCATERIDLRNIPKPCTINLTNAKWCSDGTSTSIRYFVANKSNAALANGVTIIGTTNHFTVTDNNGDMKNVSVTVTSDDVGYIRFSAMWGGTGTNDNPATFEDVKATLTYTPN